MASITPTTAPEAATAQKRPRSRKSIAHLPSSNTMEFGNAQENVNPATLTIVEPADTIMTGKADAKAKKSRSKSMGPGGLDALKETSGNRRKSAMAPVPKSILKPSIPLSPLREIPTRQQAKQNDDAKSKTNPPRSHEESEGQSQLHVGEVTVVQNPGPKVGGPRKEENDSRPELETQILSNGNAALERKKDLRQDDKEAEERRKKKEVIQKQREERRKSMANRRVSFAPEATLHTFNIEYMMDATSSSASTDATRQTALAQSQNSASAEQPTTPTEHAEEKIVARSPEHQHDVHQAKRRRRSSGIAPMNFLDADGLSPSSYGSSSPGTEDGRAEHMSENEDEDDVDSLASDSADEASGTVTTGDQFTKQGNNHDMGDADLDNSLSDAASRAGTRQLEIDENGDVSMDIADEDVAAAFHARVASTTGVGSPHPTKASKAIANQENFNPFSPAFARGSQLATQGSPIPSARDDEDMSMDMTKPMGGIVPSAQQDSSLKQVGRKSLGRKQSVASRRRSSAGSELLGEGTMDFTTAVGGIQSSHGQTVESQVDENEDLSMEFTSVYGGLQTRNQQPSSLESSNEHQQVSDAVDQDGDLEMTATVGKIIQSQAPWGAFQEENANSDKSLDFTSAIGTIKSAEASSSGGVGASASSALRVLPKTRPSLSTSAAGSPNASTGCAAQRVQRSNRYTLAPTPEKRPQTPSHLVTPEAPRPGTPGKTPPSANVSMRKPSPKKLFQQEIRAAANPAATSPTLFQEKGLLPPSAILAPVNKSHQRISGMGVDREGLGSPRIAQILDRRSSIGEKADVFAPKGHMSRGVHFVNPQVLEAEILREREEDQRRESGQFIMEREADEEERDATANLREMMQSMTPKKNKSKGRKSLATGSAKGLLGKRPAELDESEDENSPRTFGKQSSPVKKIRLQGPPSASNAAGTNQRQALAGASGYEHPVTPTAVSTPRTRIATTPKSQGRFKDAESLPSAQKPVPTLGQTEPADAEKSPGDDGDEKISLQEFLNLTNIRFLELTTTKRRPTVAPDATAEGDTSNQLSESKDNNKLLEDSIAAGACTLPMLELFQHSCRELKKYIAEGRSIVRDIESETLEENPPLFREYQASTPSDRTVMDNQFKNMKTNARLLSKATWYEWRMKLLDGLRESLAEIVAGMDGDDKVLWGQEEVLSPMLEPVMNKREALRSQCEEVKARAEELASCDPEDLKAARQRLVEVDRETSEKEALIEEHKRSMEEMDAAIEAAQEAKVECQAATKEAARLREECRGWSAAEVSKVNARVQTLSAQTGWSVGSASGTTLTMTFLDQLRLYFDTAGFLLPPSSTPSTASRTKSNNTHASPPHAPISLTYIGSSPPAYRRASPLTTTKHFFLQLLRAALHSLPQSQTYIRDVLGLIGGIWRTCLKVVREVERLALLVGPTRERIVGDERLEVDVGVLVEGVGTKVLVRFGVDVAVGLGVTCGSVVGVKEGVEIKVTPTARVVYGEGYDAGKMGAFLRKRVHVGLEGDDGAGGGMWAEGVRELKGGLVRRGRKV